MLRLAGPDPLLAFFSICVALDEPPFSKSPSTLVSTETGEQALDVLIRLYKRMDPVALGLNPIALLDRMATTNAVSYCPLVYGYTNYANAGGMDGHPLFFTNAPVFSPHCRPGSTLGGTGVAVSRKTKITPSLNAFLHWLIAPSTQADFIPSHAGQPCLRVACVNARSNRFYLDTLTTMEHSWVRPRFPGYIEFQSAGAATIRSGLLDGDLPSTIFARLTCIAQKVLSPQRARCFGSRVIFEGQPNYRRNALSATCRQFVSPRKTPSRGAVRSRRNASRHSGAGRPPRPR